MSYKCTNVENEAIVKTISCKQANTYQRIDTVKYSISSKMEDCSIWYISNNLDFYLLKCSGWKMPFVKMNYYSCKLFITLRANTQYLETSWLISSNKDQVTFCLTWYVAFWNKAPQMLSVSVRPACSSYAVRSSDGRRGSPIRVSEQLWEGLTQKHGVIKHSASFKVASPVQV